MTASLRLSGAVDSLPISVRQLARQQAMTRPISLRRLLERTGTRTTKVNIGVLRYIWQIPAPKSKGQAMWPDAMFDETFQAENGWSLHDYWSRSTLGLVDLRFEFLPWRVLRDQAQAELRADRAGIIDACRQQATSDGVELARFDHVIAFVHTPGSNAGASGGDAVFDQGGSLPFFEHEVGHVLGFDHAFGPSAEFLGPYVYRDDYCVMGLTGPQGHKVPTPKAFEAIDGLAEGFFASERRPAAASLYRYMEHRLASTSSIIRVDPTRGSVVTLVAVSEARLHDPIVAIGDSELGKVLIEYRAATGDDAGVAPAVVIHSIGRRLPQSNNHEKEPVWFEGTLPPIKDSVATSPKDIRLRLEVIEVAGDRRSVKVRLSRPREIVKGKRLTP